MENFTPIGQGIYLQEPDNNHPPSTLIILCTWLGGATPRRIAKYTCGYRSQFPDASILLITTSILDITLRPFSAIRARLGPARKTVLRIIDSNPESKILLHVFSHGGSNIAIQLARAISEANSADHVRFSRALNLVIFDCCPGDNEFQRSYNAAAVSLPETQFAQSVGKLLLYPTIGAIVGLQKSSVMSNVYDLRRDLKDPGTFGVSARRFYLYSREDEMVPWQEVESHMVETREVGVMVDGVKFDQGGHCALLMANEQRYWETIQGAWRGEGLPTPLHVQSRL